MSARSDLSFHLRIDAGPTMRPILSPMPKIREEDLAEARRLNHIDAQRGAIELDAQGAVIDDLEDRRHL
jgi:hypothetical protein